MNMNKKIAMYKNFRSALHLNRFEDGKRDTLLQIGKAALKTDDSVTPFIKRFTAKFIETLGVDNLGRTNFNHNLRADVQAYGLLLLALDYVKLYTDNFYFVDIVDGKFKFDESGNGIRVEYVEPFEAAGRVAENTINAINNYSFSTKGYVEKVLNCHRTLQQSWMRLACAVIKAIANQTWVDDRNKATVELAKKIIEIDGFDNGLPLI